MALIVHVQFFLFILARLPGLNTTFSVLHKMAMRFSSVGNAVCFLSREMPLSPGNLCSRVDRAPTKDMNKP